MLEGLKGRLEAWKRALESNGLRVNVKTKINIAKVTVEGNVPCAICKKDMGINVILCQFCRCWQHKRCSGFKGKLKEASKFKYQICVNQHTDIVEVEDCPGI